MGEKAVRAGLKDLGVRVRREDVRQALRETDRAEVGLPPIRRVYKVPWINSLWHIDGHHKLVTWKIVIHGGIDGFSRTITFLKASDNNRASTMGALFARAIGRYGLPSRVRADYGKENWDVKKFMEANRGMCSSHALFYH